MAEKNEVLPGSEWPRAMGELIFCFCVLLSIVNAVVVVWCVVTGGWPWAIINAVFLIVNLRSTWEMGVDLGELDSALKLTEGVEHG